VYRGQTSADTNTALQDFSDIQSILRSVIQQEEVEENSEHNENLRRNGIAVRGTSMRTAVEPFPPPPSNDSTDSMDGANGANGANGADGTAEDVVERIEEIGTSGNIYSVLEPPDDAPDDRDIDQTEAAVQPNLTLRIRVDIPPEPSVSEVNVNQNRNPPGHSLGDPPGSFADPPSSVEDPPSSVEDPPDPSEASDLPSDPVMVIEFYRSVYSHQVAQLLGMGYTNETLILEALMLNQGDVMEAVDWMA
jgi:hypothetical protein